MRLSTQGVLDTWTTVSDNATEPRAMNVERRSDMQTGKPVNSLMVHTEKPLTSDGVTGEGARPNAKDQLAISAP